MRQGGAAEVVSVFAPTTPLSPPADASSLSDTGLDDQGVDEDASDTGVDGS